ncbi:MAG: metallophosphoesterase [Myxococcales bacterium]|nr:metallophosphoesterase [Myxococcales bacterium]
MPLHTVVPAADAPRDLLRIAHISDLHVLDLAGTRWHQFLNKRLTGVVNLVGPRRRAHPVALAEALADRMAQPDIDHVILTGDVTNLALDSEFRRARHIIERIGPPGRVTIVPGNHDLYTRGALKQGRFEHWFGDYIVDAADADSAAPAGVRGRLHYPFVRSPAPHVRIYGLSSAVPTPPFLALGHVGRAQIERLLRLRAAEPSQVRVRIALVHHNLHTDRRPFEFLASFVDRRAFSRAMHAIGASAVLHGHTHTPHQGHLHGPGGGPDADIPVLGCGSSTWSKRGTKDRARFNVLEIGAERIEKVESYGFDAAAQTFHPEHADLLERALARAIAM